MPVDLAGRIILRWDATASPAALLKAGGVDAVWLRTGDERLASSCREAGAEVLAPDAIRLAELEDFGRAGSTESVAALAGEWPGSTSSRRTADGAVVAAATGRAWITANGYLAAYLRALYPSRDPILGYAPGRDAADTGRGQPFGGLELALVDAWTTGGNYILTPPDAFREALVSGDRNALAAWERMGRTARWLKEHRSFFRQPSLGAITALVEPGETTAEIANLLFRQSGSPEVVSAARVPPPDAAKRAVIVAAGIAPPGPDLRKALLAHARAGAAVITDAYGKDAWWRVSGARQARGFEDREFYSLGAGRIVAYKEAVVDPGEFALDAIDLAEERRPARLWNCPGGIALAYEPAPGGKALLVVVNYGSPARGEVLARRYGVFRSAELLRPGEAAVPLRAYRRGSGTEVALPGLERVGVVVFD